MYIYICNYTKVNKGQLPGEVYDARGVLLAHKCLQT